MKSRLTEDQRSQARKLLRTTELPIGTIAKRIGCSLFAVCQINRVNKIRPLRRGGGGWSVLECQ